MTPYMTITMTRQSWRSFRNYVGIVHWPWTERNKERHFIYTLQLKQNYPRIHFICEYTKDFAMIKFHLDVSEHNAINKHEHLMVFHKTMNKYKDVYPDLIKAKRLKNEDAQLVG